MRFVDEFRDPAAAARLAAALRQAVTRPWTVMEVCGGQTHAFVRFGLEALLPPELTLVHGPGCPVCVTPAEVLDAAIELAARPEVTLCTYGDMLRVPGKTGDLRQARARGGDVRVITSPLEAVELAAAAPGRQVVLLAVGFETTAPAHALAALQARARGLANFSLLVAHVLVPPALEAILGAPGNRVQGFLAAGHVCAVMGTAEYAPLVARHRVPIVVTGFEPLDLLDGLLRCVRQLEEGRAELENAYARAVRPQGNQRAQEAVAQVFRVVRRRWRGLGDLPRGGLALREELAELDAGRRFGLPEPEELAEEAGECRSGLVLQGRLKPPECPAFATRCTPDTPLGAPMVSSEGACAAYYRYRGVAR